MKESHALILHALSQVQLKRLIHISKTQKFTLNYKIQLKMEYNLKTIENMISQKQFNTTMNQQTQRYAQIHSEQHSSQEFNFNRRKQQRKSRLKSIRQHLQTTINIKERKEQSLLFYLFNLAIPLVLTCINAYVLLALGKNSQLKGQLIIIFVSAGFVFSVISNLQIAPWRQVLKLYLIIDSLLPVLVAALIGFYSVFNFLSTGQWYEHGMSICFPIWVFYFAGNIRVMIAYLKWLKWKVILFKLVVLICGLIFFYVGFNYMNGAYKVSQGYLPSVEQTVKNTVYLYVFGICDLFFEYYRKLSDFDQSNELRYEYQFKDCAQQNNKIVVREQLHRCEQQVFEEQIYDNIVTVIKIKKNISTDKSIGLIK